MHTTCTELAIFMYRIFNSMNNNILSYCGLVDAKISASDTDLPVLPANKHDCCYKVIQFEIIGLHRFVKKNIMEFKKLFLHTTEKLFK